MPVQRLLANGIGSYQEWGTPSGPRPSCIRVNGDGQFIRTQFSGKKDTYTFEDLPVDAGVIVQVDVGIIVRRIDSLPAPGHSAFWIRNGSEETGATEFVTSSFDFTLFTQSNVAAGLWTPAFVNGAQFGIIRGNSNADGLSSDCDIIFVDVNYLRTVPIAPTNLVATALSTTAIRLTWIDNAVNETGYRVYRCEGGSCGTPSVVVATLAPGVATWDDINLGIGVTYRYKVVAFNEGGDSADSNVAQTTTFAGIHYPNAMLATANMPVPRIPTVTIPATPMLAWATMVRPFSKRRPQEVDPAIGHGKLGYVDGQKTFYELVEASTADRYPLVEIGLGIEVKDWNAVGSAYQPSTVTSLRAVLTFDGIVRDIIGVQTDVLPRELIRVESVALCQATPGTFYYADGVLLVRLPDSSNPNSTNVVALLGFYYSTKSVVHPVLGRDKLTDGGFETW